MVNCSVCGRGVANTCVACPGCGNDVSRELEKKEREKKVELAKKGICPRCGGREFRQALAYRARDVQCVKCECRVGEISAHDIEGMYKILKDGKCPGCNMKFYGSDTC